MDINTLLETFKDALTQDSALSSWCIAVYGQTHKVYINIDVNSPPAETDCPYFVLYPASKSAGPQTARKRHGLVMVCCLYDDSSLTNVETNVVEYKGVKRLETLRKKGENALAAADIDPAVIDTLDIEYDTIESFPFMMAGTEVAVGQAHLIGADPLA